MPRKHVVIIGGGFAGLNAARALRHADVDVTLVDRNNHHVFQPLLYQVASSILSPSDVAVPIRQALRGQPNVTVLLGNVTAIRTRDRVVELDHAARLLIYDYLIVAAGARHSYFGNDTWAAHAPGLKSIEDALEIRRRFLLSFERAELAGDALTRRVEQTIVVVGGGPTGVELAGALPEVARKTVAREFRRTDTRRARVVLIESGPRILPTFDPKLSERARADLEARGVEVRTGTAVTRVTHNSVYLGEERIRTRTVFWAAGNVASPLGRMLGAPLDRAGRVLVRPDLSLPDAPEVFVAGDLAAVASTAGVVPAVATSAIQMGRHAARNIIASIAAAPRAAFAYEDRGSLAIIGRGKAVAQIGSLRLTGGLACALWGTVHLFVLLGFRNRARVLAEWIYAHLTYGRGDRLILGAAA